MAASRRLLERAMDEANSYADWREAAISHDKLTGMNQWRAVERSSLYDYHSIRQRLDTLRELRASKDDHGLLFTLNEGIHGNMAGMGKTALYKRAKFGTKHLIEEYVDEIVDALHYLSKLRSNKISFEERLDFFRRADHCFGRSALMLSGGAVLGHFHVGVVKAMLEEDVLPSVISGSSAGSLIAGVLGTHSTAELHEMFDPRNLLMEARQEVTWLGRLLSPSTPNMDVHDVEDTVDRLIPDLTFQEAYELTGRKINISVAPSEVHQTSRLLNAITSPNVYIRKAVMASCAVPGIYPPVILEAKNKNGRRQPYLPQRRWVDGSVSEDLPAKRLARLYGVNHYVASQTNPVVLWFIQDPKEEPGLLSTGLHLGFRTYQEWLRSTHWITQRVTKPVPRLQLLANMFYSVATQTYTGDINLMPRYRLFNPTKLLTPPSEKELMFFIKEGERATFPKIERLRIASKISRALDQILKRYERRALRDAHRISSNTASTPFGERRISAA